MSTNPCPIPITWDPTIIVSRHTPSSLHVWGSPTLTGSIVHYVTYTGECQNSHHSVWYVGTHRTYCSGIVQSRPRYINISFHHIVGDMLDHVNIHHHNVINIRAPTDMDVSRQYVSMLLCVFVSCRDMLQITIMGAYSYRNLTPSKFTLLQHTCIVPW
jgi:hypothetical protein